ncbi:DEAD/DEAH box helicase family protein [uncultured Corynebacterium sp.]|uniref:DEAD/DEAH box helicase family protein n=1 Tax=uncultured Corynebacterium sp. TaxID=159447 RepID=UPI002592D444|nr:DEAD/DEAH box helicase family protein [uncultured Corynebacterium sp.]
MSITPRPSNFGFVGQAWPQLIIECRNAEDAALTNPRASMFQSRFVLEQVIGHIAALNGLEKQSNIFDTLTNPDFSRLLPETIRSKMHILRKAGNTAVHSEAHITSDEALQALKHLYDVMVFATTHFSGKAIRGIAPFDVEILKQAPRQAALNQRQMMALAAKEKSAREQADLYKLQLDEAQQRELEQAAGYEEEIAKLREQIRKQQEKLTPPAPQLAVDEAQTRRDIITPMLEDAGFVRGRTLIEEYPVAGMKVDYVLLDTQGVPIAVVEAKKASRSINDGRQQAAIYADAIGNATGRVPLIFYTTGYEVRFWDRDADLPGGVGYETRTIESYPTVRAMEALIARRDKRQPLSAHSATITEIAGRPYQLEMIQSVAEAFGKGKRRALLVMATGTGKTRVSIATVSMLLEAGWIRNVLFLADRKALVTQAHAAFNEHLAEAVPVNLTTNPAGEGQVYVNTYQTMIGMIGEGQRFNSFDFDLIIVDEAHRSIYQRYRRIFDYLDALVVGLTATPRSNLSHDTYTFFGCEPDTPTGYYSLSRAIEEGNLVPYEVFSGSTAFMRRGISYGELTPEQQLEWENAEWGVDEHGDPLSAPQEVNAAEINAKLLNRDTIRKVLRQVIGKGLKVDGADRLGKTIIFARNQAHADLIADEYRAIFPTTATRAEVITHGVYNAEALIAEFKQPDSGLDIAISVDMLDTGIDVPEVVNLVFFKPVYSPTKFWQMVGRGTRLRPDLFGPAVDKTCFYIFDYCDNVRQFSGTTNTTEGSHQVSLSQRSFTTRARLLLTATDEVRGDVAKHLSDAVRSVPHRSILVPTEARAYLERFSDATPWLTADADTHQQAVTALAPLPFAATGDKEQARRFDYLIYQLELGLFEERGDWDVLAEKVVGIAEALLQKTNIPTVANNAALLEAIAGPQWWDGVTYSDLELARKTVRGLTVFLDKAQRAVVITDIEDELGELEQSTLQATGGTQRESSVVEEELRRALEGNTTSLALRKLRNAQQLSTHDLDELRQLLLNAHVDGAAELADTHQAKLGLFLREVVGMDAAAVEAHFEELLHSTDLNSVQRTFLNTVVSEVIRNGVVEAHELTQPPFDENGSIMDIFHENVGVVLQLRDSLEQLNNTAMPNAG